MKALRVWAPALVLVAAATAAPASAQVIHAPLLDRMVGEWVLEGTIAGEQTTSDVTIERVLGHYIRIHELSRRTGADGRPWYESLVFIGWDPTRQRFVCLWLDSTGGEGLSNGVLGYATITDDALPFTFELPGGGRIETTFRYHPESDRWSWAIDTGRPGAMKPFGRVTLTRK